MSTSARWSPISLPSHSAEARAVRDAQQIIEFCQRARRPCVALGAATHGPLHQAAAPGVGRRIADRAEQAGGGCEGATAKLRRGSERESGDVAESVGMIFEDDRRVVATAFRRVECPDTQCCLAERDMDLDISHRCQDEGHRSAVCGV